MALAWGVAIGGVAQLAFQLRGARADLRCCARPRIDWRDPGVRRVLRAMGPAVIGVSAAQISALINTQFAAWLGDGRISWITYADRLMEFPSALLGVALGTVLLPSLAKHHSDANPPNTRRCSTGGCASRSCWRCRRLSRCGCSRCRWSRTLYQYGKFSVNDALQTRDALLGYSVGLLGIVLVKILAPGFYARQMMKTPVKIAFVTVLVTQAIALTLMWRIGHAGLTLATSIGATFNAAMLFTLLKRRKLYSPQPGWGIFVAKLVVALGVLAAVLAWLAGPAEMWLHATLLHKLVRLFGVIGAGALAYFAALALMGFRFADFNRRETH